MVSRLLLVMESGAAGGQIRSDPEEETGLQGFDLTGSMKRRANDVVRSLSPAQSGWVSGVQYSKSVSFPRLSREISFSRPWVPVRSSSAVFLVPTMYFYVPALGKAIDGNPGKRGGGVSGDFQSPFFFLVSQKLVRIWSLIVAGRSKSSLSDVWTLLDFSNKSERFHRRA